MYELSRAMAREADVVWLSFAEQAERRDEGRLGIECLKARWLTSWHPLAAWPLRGRLVRLVRWADVVHVHQVYTLLSAATILLARAGRTPVFLTDLGGGHPYAPAAYLPILPLASGLLLLSEYSRRLWEAVPPNRRPECLEVILGGVDVNRFRPRAGREPGKVLFVGRLLPHKGVEYLIDAIHPPLSLTIVGRPENGSYGRHLARRVAGKPITFAGAVDDDRLAAHYSSAMATVVPSVYVSEQGLRTRVPELLGLVALESMACGTPVIVSDVASLPELVQDGRTGFVVPPNDSRAIRDRLSYLQEHPDEVERLGRAAREWVESRFTWPVVVDRCLEAYARATDSVRPAKALPDGRRGAS